MRNKKHIFREISKFMSGLVLGDLLVGVWLYFSNLLPINFLGITYTQDMIAAGMVFDIALLFLFIYYGWHHHQSSKKEREHWFHYAVGVLLIVVAIIHLLRVLFGWDFIFGNLHIPFWLNAIAAIVAGFLGITSIYLAREITNR